MAGVIDLLGRMTHFWNGMAGVMNLSRTTRTQAHPILLFDEVGTKASEATALKVAKRVQ